MLSSFMTYFSVYVIRGVFPFIYQCGLDMKLEKKVTVNRVQAADTVFSFFTLPVSNQRICEAA